MPEQSPDDALKAIDADLGRLAHEVAKLREAAQVLRARLAK